MPTQSNNSSGGGISLLGALLLIFITLKLCSVIAWSWWWVLCPIWIPFAIALCFFTLLAISGK